jgi:hypothetical protein
MLDYSRCALIRHVPDGYIVHHYGRKPDITVMIGHWTRHHKDEYPEPIRPPRKIDRLLCLASVWSYPWDCIGAEAKHRRRFLYG